MAKKSESGVSFAHLLGEIRASRLAPFYLLQGEEPYFIDRLSEALRKAAIPDESAREFDETILYGADATIDQLAGAARQYPMMGERVLAMLKEAQSLRDARGALAKLEPLALKPSPGAIVAVTFKAEPLKESHALVKAVRKGGGVVFNSTKLREWELNTFITDYCHEKNTRIDRKATEMLKEYVGADLSRLAADIDKLAVATSGGAISAETIEKNIGYSKDFNNFELIRAFSRRDYAACMRIVDYFERNPADNPVIVTVAMLFRYFSQLMLAHYAPERSDRALMAQLGMHSPWQLGEIKPGLQNYRAASVLRIIHALRLLDCHSKGIGSVEKDYQLLRQFVYEAFTL